MENPLQDIRERTVHVVQGEYYVSDNQGVMLSTVLGSCVAACLYDPIMRIGGMNHFLLPGNKSGSSSTMTYGSYAMELLINDLLKRGCSRDRLEAKVFGGARMMQGLSDIGEQNAAFIKEYLLSERIKLISDCLGGTQARRIRFWPTSGRVRQLILGKNEEANLQEKVQTTIDNLAPTGDVELF